MSALNQMGPLKVLGPDGFSAGFFQQNWETMGVEVHRVALDTLNSSIMPPHLNMTHIVLIPKIKDPLKVMDFRPISLCNVLYKLIFKVLANCLKRVLPTIISPTQSAFIHGRLILDNILVVYETLHTMHSRMSRKKRFYGGKARYEQGIQLGRMEFFGGYYESVGFCHMVD